MSKAKIVNIFGGPGAGKSCTAYGIAYNMKMGGFSVELLHEFAKDLTYEKRFSALDCQDYVFGKQWMQTMRLADSVEYIITDSPVLLSAAYAKQKDGPVFIANVIQKFNSLNNINYVLNRDGLDYKQQGRTQTYEEACALDKKVMGFLEAYGIPYKEVKTVEAVDLIVSEMEKYNDDVSIPSSYNGV